MFISCALVGITIIGRFFYLRHKASVAMRQKDRPIEHKDQINYIELLNKMMVCLFVGMADQHLGDRIYFREVGATH